MFLFCYRLNRQPEKCVTEGGKALVNGPEEISSLLASSVSSDILERKELGAAG